MSTHTYPPALSPAPWPRRYEDSAQFSTSQFSSYDSTSVSSATASVGGASADLESGQTEVDQHQAAAARRPVVYQASSPDEVALVTWTEMVSAAPR